MNRREFLSQAAGVAAAIAATSLRGDDNLPASRIVDTHTHFYDPTRKEGVPWPDKDSPLYRKVLPKDWLAVASPSGVKETVVVEASEWPKDNAWILELAEKERSIVGFVGHLLPHTADFPEQLKSYSRNPIFRGIRVSNADFLKHSDTAEFRKGAAMLADAGLSLDINGPVTIHQAGAKLAGAIPALRIVLDHVGSAGDAAQLSAEWRNGIKALGDHQNVFCKVSALMEQTEASSKKYGNGPRETAYYAPVLDLCWEHFGADRLIYGSNWPVSEKGGTYADEMKIVGEYFGAKGREACEKYFWKNSRVVYGWLDRAAK